MKFREALLEERYTSRGSRRERDIYVHKDGERERERERVRERERCT